MAFSLLPFPLFSVGTQTIIFMIGLVHSLLLVQLYVLSFVESLLLLI